LAVVIKLEARAASRKLLTVRRCEVKSKPSGQIRDASGHYDIRAEPDYDPWERWRLAGVLELLMHRTVPAGRQRSQVVEEWWQCRSVPDKKRRPGWTPFE
jgi:hypothetical protein